MKSNQGKFQSMGLGVKNIAPFRLNVNGKIIPCSNEVKLMGISRIFVRKHLINYMPLGEEEDT